MTYVHRKNWSLAALWITLLYVLLLAYFWVMFRFFLIHEVIISSQRNTPLHADRRSLTDADFYRSSLGRFDRSNNINFWFCFLLPLVSKARKCYSSGSVTVFCKKLIVKNESLNCRVQDGSYICLVPVKRNLLEANLVARINSDVYIENGYFETPSKYRHN